MRDAFVREVSKAAAADRNIMIVTGDLGFGVLTRFSEQFPDQFVNAGVAEQNMTAIACGLAMAGKKVFTYSIANFTTLRCLEQLRNDVAYHGADVTAVAVGGGFSYGQLGMSHHATEDLAILRAMPGMRVFAPTSVWEAEEVTKGLLRSRGPAYLRLDKDAAESAVPIEPFALGSARVVADGADVTLVATGGILSEVLRARARLADEGIRARVIAVHSVKPLDRAAILAAAAETAGIITVEEHTRVGGLGSAVAESLFDSGRLPGFLYRMGLDDVFPTIVGTQSYLRSAYGLDADAIRNQAIQALAGVGRRPKEV